MKIFANAIPETIWKIRLASSTVKYLLQIHKNKIVRLLQKQTKEQWNKTEPPQSICQHHTGASPNTAEMIHLVKSARKTPFYILDTSKPSKLKLCWVSVVKPFLTAYGNVKILDKCPKLPLWLTSQLGGAGLLPGVLLQAQQN